MSTTTTNYFPEGNIVSTVSYEYDDTDFTNILPESTTTHNSDGKEHKTTLEYQNAIPTITKKFVAGNLQEGKHIEYNNDMQPVDIYHILADESENRISHITYGADGMVITARQFPDAANPPIKTTYTWANGLLQTISQGDHVSSYTYNSKRDVQKITAPDGTSSYIQYDGLNRLENIYAFSESPNNNKAQTSYQYVYDNTGTGRNRIVETTTFADGTPSKTTTQRFDGLGRSGAKIAHDFSNGSDQFLERAIFDEYGRPHIQSFAPGRTKTIGFEPSPLNRVISETYPGGGEIQIDHGTNANGIEAAGTTYPSGTLFKTTTTDEIGNESSSYTDLLGRVVMTEDALDGQTRYAYFDHGRIKQVLSPEDAEYNYTYDDERILLTSKSIPGRGITSYAYNDKYQLETTTDEVNDVITNIYDGYNRIIETQLNETTISTQVYGTTGIKTGKITSSSSALLPDGNIAGNVTETYEYDDYGRVTSTTTINHTGLTDITSVLDYDDADRALETNRVINDINFKYISTYDTWDKMLTNSVDLGDEPQQLSEYQYDVFGQVFQKKCFNRYFRGVKH